MQKLEVDIRDQEKMEAAKIDRRFQEIVSQINELPESLELELSSSSDMKPSGYQDQGHRHD